MVEKETQFHKIKRIGKSQKNIRNIATSAHIHHGKCITANSRIVLTNGAVKTAKEIFEEVSKKGEIYGENEEHTIFIPKDKLEIFSLNKSTGKIEKKSVQYVWRLVGGKTIKIKLRNGFEIETTPEHKYLVFRNNLKEVEAKDLRLGDRVVCARKIHIDVNEGNIKGEILKKLSEKNFYVNLQKEFSSEFNKKILSYGIKNIKFTIKPKSFYHGIWQNRYNLKDLIEVCDLFKINLNELYDKKKIRG
jgi:intein/homing endonuclease